MSSSLTRHVSKNRRTKPAAIGPLNSLHSLSLSLSLSLSSLRCLSISAGQSHRRDVQRTIAKSVALPVHSDEHFHLEVDEIPHKEVDVHKLTAGGVRGQNGQVILASKLTGHSLDKSWLRAWHHLPLQTGGELA